jgi:hypothetical protein
MDDIQTKRKKKSDKAKKNFDLHGGKSSKHVRLQELMMEKRATVNDCFRGTNQTLGKK